MTPSKRRQLLRREIARVVEAAYRRGFQQGHDTATRGDAVPVDLTAWRFGVPLHRSPSPHGRGEITADERLGHDHPGIAQVIAAAVIE